MSTFVSSDLDVAENSGVSALEQCQEAVHRLEVIHRILNEDEPTAHSNVIDADAARVRLISQSDPQLSPRTGYATRSRGPVPEQPNVQPTVVEYLLQHIRKHCK